MAPQDAGADGCADDDPAGRMVISVRKEEKRSYGKNDTFGQNDDHHDRAAGQWKE